MMTTQPLRSMIARLVLVGTMAAMLFAGFAALHTSPASASVSAVAANCQHLMNEGNYYLRVGRSLMAIKEYSMAHEFFETSESYFNQYIANCA
jgi:hypothetical protein